MKYAIVNLGCKVNAFEAEAVSEMLSNNGHTRVSFDEQPDATIVFTCAVTNTAAAKSRKILHQAKRIKEDEITALVGCYVQVNDGLLEEADILVGSANKKKLPQYIEQYLKNHEKIRDIASLENVPFDSFTSSVHDSKARCDLKIQDGCNQFCSYCIIPYARGRVRSRSRDSVLEEVKTLAANGYKEVVLTGIHLSSYGIDCDDNLLSLILAIHEVDGIERIRLGSLEPRIITEEFVQTIAQLPKMCPHFHLSLQSGCNATLKRMNRRYTAEEYYEKCRLLRKYFHNPALTTDVIVGFPGETEEEFAESKAFVDKVDFYETHIFKYSRREGTKAAAMKDQVPDQIKAVRSAELIELSHRKQAAYEERLIGTTQEVLIEEKIIRNGEELQIGHTKEYVKIGVKNPNNLINQLVNVEIENQLQILH